MINAEVLLVVQAVATVMAMGSILCRAARMTAQTPLPVRMQHAALFAGLAFSLVLPALEGKTVMALGILSWLSMAAYRWRHGLPDGLQSGD